MKNILSRLFAQRAMKKRYNELLIAIYLCNTMNDIYNISSQVSAFHEQYQDYIERDKLVKRLWQELDSAVDTINDPSFSPLFI